jgi:peptidoglycan/LPS O-acetylase OafA/YrhL
MTRSLRRIPSLDYLKGMGKSLSQLDFVRAVAVLLVFVGHLIHTMGYDRAVGTVAHFGVELFFIHTALVLFLSLERINGDFTMFYIRRIFRIYPLSILAILCAIAFQIPATSWGDHYKAPDLLGSSSNLLLIQNLTGQRSIITVLWSLPLEVQMYALLPFLFALYKRRVSVFVMWGCFVILAFAFPTFHPERNFFLFGPCFCSGIIAYRALKRSPGVISFPMMAGGIAGLILLNQLLALVFAPVALSHSVVCILAGLLIGRSAPPQTAFIRHVSATIAKYSYGIYLSHVPLMWLCFRHKRGIPELAAFGLAAVVVPLLAFHLVEAPLIRLGTSLTRPTSTRSSEVCSIEMEAKSSLS